MKNMTTQAAMEYIETLHQRSNDARHMSICEKVNEAKHALIRERDELESKCNAYDTLVIAMLLRCISSCLRLMEQKSSRNLIARATSCAMQLLMKLST